MVVKWLWHNTEELLLCHYKDPESHAKKVPGYVITNISARFLRMVGNWNKVWWKQSYTELFSKKEQKPEKL